MTDVKAPDYAQQFDVFNKLYQAMASAINQLPIAQRYKDLIGQNLDQSFMWAREAFTLLIQQQQSSPPVETVQPPEAKEAALPADFVAALDAANDH
jgi:hypothetical protein